MNHARPLVPQKAVSLSAPWARGQNLASQDLASMSEAEAAFFAGAALQSLDGLVRDEPDWAGMWRARMALKAAAVSSSLLGQGQEEGSLRDAICLTRPGGDPGPAGRVLLAWRKLGRHSTGVDQELLVAVADLFGGRPDGDFAKVTTHIEALAQSGGIGPFAAIDAAEHIAGVYPALTAPAELLGFWLADLVLASRLKWPRPVPLLVSQAQKSFFRAGADGRRLRMGEAGWRKACLIAFALAAQEAGDAAADAARRTERLKMVAPKLRAKGSARIVEALLQDDALLPSAWAGAFPEHAMTDRAVRRLFERLVTLGAVRELTGRSTFRLYGL